MVKVTVDQEIIENKNDEELMELVKDEDERAFGVLVKRYLPKALSFADKYIRDLSDDMVQEAFIKVWRSAKSFNSEKGKFKTWFYTIITNTCYRILKKQNIKNNMIFDVSEIKDIPSDFKPEKDFSEKKNYSKLQDTFKFLKKREKQVIISRYFNDYTNKETAQIMGTTVKAIETLLVRVRKKIKQYYCGGIK
jgi:RNA polymerase sigma-70 factor, ECF subfamily